MCQAKFWIKKIELAEEYQNYILFSVSTRFIRDWITSRYLDQILQIIRLYKKDIIRIELIAYVIPPKSLFSHFLLIKSVDEIVSSPIIIFERL